MGTAGSLPLTVNLASVTLLETIPNPSSVEQAFLAVATVAPRDPSALTLSGTVAFQVDGVEVQRVGLDATGQAEFLIGGLEEGPHEIVARYLGDENFAVSQASVTQSVEANHAPVLSVPLDQLIKDEQTLQFVPSELDVDNDPLLFLAANLPPGATLDAVTGAFAWTTTCDQVGIYDILISVEDGRGGIDVETVEITVTNQIHWTGQGDGVSWNDARNWLTGALPGECDDVFINDPSGVTIVHSSGEVSIRSLHSSNPLDFTGTLSLAAKSALNGAFSLNGALNLAAGAVLNLTGGGNIFGSVGTALGSVVSFTQNAFNVFGGTVFSGPGVVEVLNQGVMNVAGLVLIDNLLLGEQGAVDGPGTLEIVKNEVWKGGELRGTGKVVVKEGATLTATEKEAKTIVGRTLENRGVFLQMEIAGPGTNLFDRFTILGSASLDGALDVTVLASAQVRIGAQFSLVSFATRTGRFANITVSGLAPDLVFQPIYTQRNVSLIARRNAGHFA